MLALRDSLPAEPSATQWSFGETKTHTVRVLTLPPITVASLKAHRAGQATQRLALGEHYRRDLDLIVAGPTGEPLSMATLGRRPFHALLRRAGLPSVSLYALRHSLASVLLTELPVKTVQTQLGHATAKLTLDTYGHRQPNALTQAAATMDRLLANERVAT